jgi:hypothetical protein
MEIAHHRSSLVRDIITIRTYKFTTADDTTVYLNFCDNVPQDCHGESGTILAFDNKQSCRVISGNANNLAQWALKSIFILIPIDSSDLYGGLTITMATGEICQADNSRNYTVTYDMECLQNSQSTEFEVINKNAFSLNTCDNLIKVRTSEACPDINYYIISAFLDKYKLYAGVILIILGLFLIFLGNKFIKLTVLLVAMIASTTLLFIAYFFIFNQATNTSIWIILAAGVILGFILGYCLCKMTRLFILILGGYIGYLVSIFLYNLLLNNIHASPQVIYWINMLVCILVFAFLALWLAKVAIVVATSIIGGYMVIRGVSLYIGGFPSESVIIDLIKNGEWDGLQKVRFIANT